MTIRAVIFDMGGTIETFSYTREFRLSAMPGLRAIMAEAGVQFTLSDGELLDVITAGLRRYHQWRMQTFVELPPEQIWRDYILAGYLDHPHGLDAVAEELMFIYETRFYHRRLRPEVPGVLEAIRQMGFRIGLISNVSSRGQVPFNLTEYGIIHYFDPIVLSSAYGRRKPDPAIFHYAARLADSPASQCLYVGDRIARDIVGARRAGYGKAIQIRHNFEHGEDDQGACPDAVIHSMTELLDILQAETAQAAANPPDEDTRTPAASPTPVRAFLFDAGDVLYFRPNRGDKLSAYLQELSLCITDNHLAQKQRLSDQAYQGQITQEAYREAVLRLYGVTQTEQIARGKQILEEEDNDVQFFDGVASTLAALKKKGYLLGIITDTANPVHVKLGWFETGGFGDVWDTIISSQELGVRKPAPAIYQAALRQLGLSPQEAVFVGHKTSELEGARAVGIKTIAFNYDEDAAADGYIQDFAELLELDFVTAAI